MALKLLPVAEIQTQVGAFKVEVESIKEEKDSMSATDKSVIRGFIYKNVIKFDKIDIQGKDYHEFNAWYDLVTVNLCTRDNKWESVLQTFENIEKEIIDENSLKKFMDNVTITEDGFRKAQQYLYLNLLQFIEGESHSRVVAGRIDQSLESYRQLVVKARNALVTILMDQRMRTMQFEKANILEEVDMRLSQWRSDIRILRESRQSQDLEMLNNHDR